MDDVALLDPFELPDEEQPAPAPTDRKRRAATSGKPQARLFSIRLLPSERRTVDAAARRAQARGTSSWARETLLAAATDEDVPIVGEEARLELLRLRRDLNSGPGANLNQAMRLANEMRRMGESPDEDAVVAAIREATAALNALKSDLGRITSPRGRR